MDAFASVEEFQARYPDDGAGDRLEGLLLDATAFISGFLRNSSIAIDPEDEIQKRNLTAVTCAMVHRQVAVDKDRDGLSQYSMTAGSYTESGTLANPSGDMYLTATEKRLLGLAGRGRPGSLFSIRPKIEGAGDDW